MRLLVLTATGILMGCALGVAMPEPSSQIAFVRVELTASGARVLSTETVDGRLKPSRSGSVTVLPGQLRLDVTAEDGAAAVWSEAIPNPLERRVEFVQEDGTLATRVDRVPTGEVTVRMPVVARRQTLAFSKPSEAGLVPMVQVEVSL